MRMVHDYEEFCKLNAEGKVEPDIRSNLGAKSVDALRNRGWKIGHWRTKNDLLKICSQSPENFNVAYTQAGIDFWVKD